MRYICTIFALLALLAPVAGAVVIYVPEEQPTIQAGIDAAENGDIVNVVDGVYYGPGNIDLDFKGKEITVRSGNGPDFCVIEPQFFNRAVRFRNGEGRNSVLEGFTIRQGFTTGDGAAILVGPDCSPTIADCVITENLSLGMGGGIHCRAGSMPLITGNKITWNEAADGGAISLFNCDPVISSNQIRRNTASNDGGAIHLRLCRAELANNLFYRNEAGRFGGAIHSEDGRLLVRSCTIDRNYADHEGGGIRGLRSVIELIDTILANDTAPFGPEISSGEEGNPSHLTVSYCNVKGGASLVEIAPGSTLTFGPGVLFTSPGFMSGDYGIHYLRNTLAGQTSTSACVDTGSDASVNVTFPGADGDVAMSQLITRVDDWPDDGQLDMGFHYQPYRRLWKTVDAGITCIPDSGTLPLNTRMWVRMHNVSPIITTRQYAVRINLQKRNGHVIRQWRAGYTNVGADYYWDTWITTIPAMGPMVGDLKFIMVVEDVTSPPYNLPPYPPAGSTDTDIARVTTFAP